MKKYCSFVPVRIVSSLKDEKEYVEIDCAPGKFSQFFYDDYTPIFFTLDGASTVVPQFRMHVVCLFYNSKLNEDTPTGKLYATLF